MQPKTYPLNIAQSKRLGFEFETYFNINANTASLYSFRSIRNEGKNLTRCFYCYSVIIVFLSAPRGCDLLKGVNASPRGSCFAKFGLNCIRLKVLPWKPICQRTNENPSRAFLTCRADPLKQLFPSGRILWLAQNKSMDVFHILHAWYCCVFVGWQSLRSICIHQRNCNVSSPIWIGLCRKPLTPPVSEASLSLWTKTESICLSNAELPRFKTHLGR